MPRSVMLLVSFLAGCATLTPAPSFYQNRTDIPYPTPYVMLDPQAALPTYTSPMLAHPPVVRVKILATSRPAKDPAAPSYPIMEWKYSPIQPGKPLDPTAYLQLAREAIVDELRHAGVEVAQDVVQEPPYRVEFDVAELIDRTGEKSRWQWLTIGEGEEGRALFDVRVTEAHHQQILFQEQVLGEVLFKDWFDVEHLTIPVYPSGWRDSYKHNHQGRDAIEVAVRLAVRNFVAQAAHSFQAQTSAETTHAPSAQ